MHRDERGHTSPRRKLLIIRPVGYYTIEVFGTSYSTTDMDSGRPLPAPLTCGSLDG